MNQEIINYLQIFFILSPIFLTIYVVSLAIRYGMKKLSKHGLYWLISSVIISVALVYGLLTDNISTYSVFLGAAGLSGAWGTYLLLKKKGK